jgi:uncharacterized protein YqgC (DUF456 family)
MVLVQLLDLIAILLALLGLLGVIVPILPGPPLIFLAALMSDYGHQWTAFGWEWLGVLFILMLVAQAGEFWASNLGAKKGGASWLSLTVGAILSFIGAFIFPPFGFLIGAIIGVVGTELLISQDARRALKAGRGWLLGWILSLILQGSIALVMVGIVIWQIIQAL